MLRATPIGHLAQLLLLALACFSTSTIAQSCGGQGEEPCIVNGRARCDENFSLNAKGNRCVPCNNGQGNPCPGFCGAEGEVCCPDGNPDFCDPGLTCSEDVGGVCTVCGGVGEACCALGAACDDVDLACSGETSTCSVNCGGDGDACCVNSDECNNVDSACSGDPPTCSVNCGGEGEACCVNGDECGTVDLACSGDPPTCSVNCGGDGDACCVNGVECNDDLGCSGDPPTCSAAGLLCGVENRIDGQWDSAFCLSQRISDSSLGVEGCNTACIDAGGTLCEYSNFGRCLVFFGPNDGTCGPLTQVSGRQAWSLCDPPACGTVDVGCCPEATCNSDLLVCDEDAYECANSYEPYGY